MMSVLARPVRIAVVDDQSAFRDAVRGLVEHEDAFTWVGSAPDGDAMGPLVEESGADLLLLDVNLPGRDGIELAAELHRSGNPVVVVLCSTYDVHDLPASVDECGARAYLRKEDLSADVLAEVWERRPTRVHYFDDAA